MSASKSYAVTFMTTVDVNVGDEFIREGVRAALDASGLSYRLHLVNKHDADSVSRPYRDECGILGDKYFDTEIFIQTGAPVYWRLEDGRSTSLTSDWHQWLWEQRILSSDARRPLFLNLGAGSCMPWGDDGASFLSTPACVDFVKRAGARAALTTVRDPLADAMLSKIGVSHQGVVCPAFLAGARHGPARPPSGHIGINLMQRGAHFSTREDFSHDAWKIDCEKLLTRMRLLGPVVFIAHDAEEAAFMSGLIIPGERVVTASDWRGYFDLYSTCSLVVANRVHGAVCAAGFGVPSLIMGTDTRSQIGEYAGIPYYQSGVESMEVVIARAEALFHARETESLKLLAIRDKALAHLAGELRKVFTANGIAFRRTPAPTRSFRQKIGAWVAGFCEK